VKKLNDVLKLLRPKRDPASKAIYKFYNEFKKLGYNNFITIKLEQINENLVELNEIWSDKEIGKGYASKTIKLLIKWCQFYQSSITLMVLPLRYSPSKFMDRDNEYTNRNKKYLNKIALTIWYKKYGFELVDHKDNLMIRNFKR
jgi:hypothetical protein